MLSQWEALTSSSQICLCNTAIHWLSHTCASIRHRNHRPATCMQKCPSATVKQAVRKNSSVLHICRSCKINTGLLRMHEVLWTTLHGTQTSTVGHLCMQLHSKSVVAPPVWSGDFRDCHELALFCLGSEPATLQLAVIILGQILTMHLLGHASQRDADSNALESILHTPSKPIVAEMSLHWRSLCPQSRPWTGNSSEDNHRQLWIAQQDHRTVHECHRLRTWQCCGCWTA